MTAISLFSTPYSAAARSRDESFKMVALVCCVGLVASFGLMTFGLDLAAGWM